MMKLNVRLVVPVLIALAVVLIVILDHSHTAVNKTDTSCGGYRKDKVVQMGTTKIDAEVPTTVDDANKGLGGRPCIGQNQAMFFMFDHSSYYQFWMKNMRFPIDIVWIDTNHKVVALEQNIQPSSYPDKFVNKDHLAQYVLELQGNRAKSLHLSLGTFVTF